jgi:hypothetical protein
VKYPDGEEKCDGRFSAHPEKKGTAGALFIGYIAVSMASSMTFLVLAFIFNVGIFGIIIIYILSGAAGVLTLAFLIILRGNRRANRLIE